MEAAAAGGRREGVGSARQPAAEAPRLAVDSGGRPGGCPSCGAGCRGGEGADRAGARRALAGACVERGDGGAHPAAHGGEETGAQPMGEAVPTRDNAHTPRQRRQLDCKPRNPVLFTGREHMALESHKRKHRGKG